MAQFDSRITQKDFFGAGLSATIKGTALTISGKGKIKDLALLKDANLLKGLGSITIANEVELGGIFPRHKFL